MNIQSTLNPTADQGGPYQPGSKSLVAHVVTAAALGNGLTAIVVWCFELGHIVPPEVVVAGFGTLCALAASWIMQKIAQ